MGIFLVTLKQGVEIIKINTPPILSDIEEAPIYFPSFDQVQITNNINISDQTLMISKATIDISSGFVAGEDQQILVTRMTFLDLGMMIMVYLHFLEKQPLLSILMHYARYL